MNKFNLRRLKLFDVVADEQIGARSSHISVRLADGHLLGITSPPTWSEDDRFAFASPAVTDPAEMEFIEPFPSTRAAVRALIALAALGKAIADANADRRLSDEGRAERIRTAGADKLRVIGEQYDAARRDRVTMVDGMADELFVKPLVVAIGDLQTSLIDQELRSRYHSGTDGARIALLAGIANGKHERLVAALMRDPMGEELPEQAAGVVTTAWRKSIADREPAKFAAWAAANAAATWAAHVLDAVIPLAIEMSRLDRLAIYRAIAPTEAVDAFGIDPTTQVAFAAQIAAVAA